jgi:UDP-N-acetylmuramate--alanine ligase
VAVVDDYAHHPTEIEATLAAVRDAYPARRLVALFQPHLFTRTRDFSAGFGRALARADVVWVTDVFPAREKPIPGVSGELVSDAARAAGAAEVHDHPSVDDVPDALARSLRRGDVLVTMGAGSVEAVGARVLERLRGAHG